MSDPFATRFDLLPGHSVPYTDDPDAYDPTAALAVYSLSKRDPMVDNSDPPQDQSAALLDQSVFAPPADLGILGPHAPPAATYTAPDGTQFHAPAGTDFNDVQQAGRDIRKNWTPWGQYDALRGNLGHHGTFDYQRQGISSDPDFANASNFAVGAFMNGAGYSWPATVILGDGYALTHDGFIPPHDEEWWRRGYDAATNGQLPKKGTP